MTKKTLGAALVVLLLAGALPGAAQITVKPSGTLRVLGDSTLHHWDSSATVVNMTFTLNDGAPADLTAAIKAAAVKTMTVAIPVAGLKSGESGLDKNLRKTMMDDKYPDVVYKLLKYELGKAEGSVIPAKTTGELTIAGQTKTVAMDVEFRSGPDGMSVKGQYDLKMSEYGIKPPSLMLGAIKVRDPVTIRFDLLLKAAK